MGLDIERGRSDHLDTHPQLPDSSEKLVKT